MIRLTAIPILPVLLAAVLSYAQTSPARPPLRVGIVGLVHGHVHGFLDQSRHSPEIEIVGIAEPDRQLLSQAATRYGFDQSALFTDLEDMIAKAHPQAVLAYTNTYDHRRVVEIAARHGIHVMMEKPLAVSLDDALAIEKAAQAAKVHVLVNYETSWYRSNHAAYDLVHEGALGEIRKVVVHDGHSGPKEIGVEPEFLAWLTDPKLNGAGALFDFGCYGADLMTWLTDGQRPESVTAVTQQIKPQIYSRVDDEATIILTYPRAQAIVQASWNWPFDRKDMEVYGQTGYAITVKRDDIRVRRKGEDRDEQIAAKPVPAPYDNSLSYLRAVILDGAKQDSLSSLETNVTVTEILDAARRSAQSGKTVRLPSAP
ncbi:MAG TPA: Gfo/Idh/MocA family oxidoreductase [Candidatus Sulfotelmatobacter sp.]|jgi:predicted dehydrogenase|nr:Gfo/Idh/MocA family oxidoreductase [Candidatus Sulfotelmatobacter sp.]